MIKFLIEQVFASNSKGAEGPPALTSTGLVQQILLTICTTIDPTDLLTALHLYSACIIKRCEILHLLTWVSSLHLLQRQRSDLYISLGTSVQVVVQHYFKIHCFIQLVTKNTVLCIYIHKGVKIIYSTYYNPPTSLQLQKGVFLQKKCSECRVNEIGTF